jgi:hypothetical protein
MLRLRCPGKGLVLFTVGEEMATRITKRLELARTVVRELLEKKIDKAQALERLCSSELFAQKAKLDREYAKEKLPEIIDWLLDGSLDADDTTVFIASHLQE